MREKEEMVICLDEFDVLLDNLIMQHQLSCFLKLVEMRSLKVICISNQHSLALGRLAVDSRVVQFAGYAEDEIMEIMEARVKGYYQ